MPEFWKRYRCASLIRLSAPGLTSLISFEELYPDRYLDYSTLPSQCLVATANGIQSIQAS